MRSPAAILAALALAALALAAASAPAFGQCTLYRAYVPDFDQKRSGLPEGGGSVHCVPTSAVNWMAYIANNGYPNMMSGPRNWQAAANYAYVTSQIELMGTFMNTNLADGGTKGGNGQAGLTLFMLTRGPYFTVSHQYGYISPFDMHFHMLTNGLVNICYGYYKQFPTFNNQFFYQRDGGHCTTLNGIENACSATPRVRLRNPADDDATTSQSTFTTVTSLTQSQTFFTDPLLTQTATRFRMLDFGTNSTTRRYVDSMYVIRASFACWAPASPTPQITISKAFTFFPDPQPATVNINAISNAPIKALSIHPNQIQAVYLSEIVSPAARVNKLFKINLADGTQSELLTFPAGRLPFAFNRFGDLFVCDANTLKCFDLSTNPPTLKHSRTLTNNASSIVCDDALNEVVVLTPANRRLIRLPYTLASAIDEPLPSAVPAIPGDGSVVPDPTATGKFLLAIAGSPSIHQLSIIPGSPRLQLDNSLLLPAVQSIQAINICDGSVAVLADGSVKHLDRDPLANRLRVSPDQPFAGLANIGALNLSYSRTNFDPALHDGPAYDDVYLPESVPGIPDCPADFDGNTLLNTLDIFTFLNAWFAASPSADFDASGALSTQDIFTFLNAWFAGC